MADPTGSPEVDEYNQMNNAYKKRIVQTLRDPMSGPVSDKGENMTHAVDSGEINMQDAGQYTQNPRTMGEIFKPKDAYTNSLRGRISDAMSKYMGPKTPDPTK